MLDETQVRAIEGALAHVKSGAIGNFSIAGLAGTGKTTTLIELVKSLRREGFTPYVGAFTNKAVRVINRKQKVFGARTMHSRFLMPVGLSSAEKAQYKALGKMLDLLNKGKDVSDEHGNPLTLEKDYDRLCTLHSALAQRVSADKWEPRDAEDFLCEHDVIIIDETSMVSRHLADQCFSHIDCPKIFFGDPGQLPPVADNDADEARRVTAVDLDNADVVLHMIHRQASDSAILPLSYTIRNHGHFPEVHELPTSVGLTYDRDMKHEHVADLLSDSQGLCWTHKVRRSLFRLHREKYLRSPETELVSSVPWLPLRGERLYVSGGRMFPKGVIIVVKEGQQTNTENPMFMDATVYLEDAPDELFPVRLKCGYLALAYGADHGFDENDARYKRAVGWQPQNDGVKTVSVQPGSVLTVHASQGSEFPRVTYYDDMPHSHEQWRKLAYTAVTRASEHVTVCTHMIGKPVPVDLKAKRQKTQASLSRFASFTPETRRR